MVSLKVIKNLERDEIGGKPILVAGFRRFCRFYPIYTKQIQTHSNYRAHLKTKRINATSIGQKCTLFWKEYP